MKFDPNKIREQIFINDTFIADDEKCFLVPVTCNDINPAMAMGQNVPYGIRKTEILKLHGLGYKGQGVKVAILDTGINSGHPDLAGRVKKSKDYTGSHNGYADVSGHGTHVCGIVCANDNDLGVIGYAPEAMIHNYKVLGDNGSGSFAWVNSAIKQCIQDKVDIINLSLGGNGAPAYLHSTIKDAVKKGIFVICAAGNMGQEDSIGYPARWEECVAVGAVNKDYQVSAFSSRGDQIDISAPGEHIVSTSSRDGYVVMSGTSMATPCVSGCLAVLLSAGVKKEFLLKLVYSTAVDIETPEWDNKSGYGVVAPHGAYLAIGEPPEPQTDCEKLMDELIRVISKYKTEK